MRKFVSSLLSTLILMSYLAMATGSISISSVTIPTSATQGDSFTITLAVSGSEATDVSGTLTLPSGLSCTPTGSQSISLSGSGSGSASWSCSADVAGDYSNGITVSVTATDSGTSGSLSDTKQTGLSVLSPASLTATSSLSSSSITAGGSSTYTIAINNLGDSATTFNITLDCPAGTTCTPSSQANTAISGTALVNNDFTISSSTAGTYAITGTIKSPVQTDLTVSKTLTVSAAATTTTAASGSGGGGGGGGAATETKQTTTVQKIEAGKPTQIAITKADIDIREIELVTSKDVSSVNIAVSEVSSKPSSVTEIAEATVNGKKYDYKAYSYLEVTHTNLADADIQSAKIKFDVSKAWLDARGYKKESVLLQRFSSKWSRLNTRFVSQEGDKLHFEADSPGLSVFVISIAIPVTTEKSAEAPAPSIIAETATTQTPEVAGSGNFVLVGILAALVVAIGAYFFMNKKKAIKL